MKKALITGAAGGLGKVVVRSLLASGYEVIAVDQDTAGISDLSRMPGLRIFKVDITDPQEVHRLVKPLELEDTGLDLLINLAGIYDIFPVTEGHYESLEKMMKVNFLGTARMINTFINPLIKSKGRIIVVSSESYKIQAMFQPYMITKAALETYCHTAWQELSLKGVRLSVIRPGAFNTRLLSWMDRDYPDDHISVYSRELRQSLEQSKKLVGRITSPEKVGRKIIRAVKAKKPKRYYHVNNNPLLSVISLMPDRILDRIIVMRFRQK